MEIEILKQDASDANLDYLNTLFINTLGLDVSIKEVESFEKDSYKILSYELIKELGVNSNFFVFYNSTQEGAPSTEEVSKVGRTTPGCLGIIDLSKDEGFYIPFITSFLNNHNVMKTQKGLLKKLNGVMQSVLGQLQRVKGLHEKVVPVRNESFRGVDLSSRFCAGTSSGGEFFDIFKTGENLWFFSINASSYITIGTFLSLIETWKQTSSLSMQLIFEALRSGEEEFKGLGEISILICRVDLITFDVESYNVGSHEIVNNEKVVISKNNYTYPDNYSVVETSSFKLDRGEQVVLLSPGFFKNTAGQISDKSYYTFIKDNWTDGSHLIQELTYQSKKKYNELDFMPYDQTVITLGVNKNAIAKV